MNQIKILVPIELRNQILKTFKQDSFKVYSLIRSLRENPRKGKPISVVGDMFIKELKCGSFRFYYVLNGSKLIFFTHGQINDLLIRFITMSKKNNQQKTIDKLKGVLENL